MMCRQPKKLFLILVSLTTLWSGISTAEVVKGLYEASVPVSSQSRQERQQALQAALSEILVRVSGRQEVASGLPLPEIEAALMRPSRYTQQFRYHRVTLPADTEDAEPVAAQVLWAKFDQAAIDDLLRRSGLPVWGRTRPATLVWLAIDDRGQRFLVSNNDTHQAKELLMSKAQRRGIPLRLPLLDLTDSATVRISDVWGNFEENIMKASSRYQPDGILVGQVYQGFNGFWHARWTFHLQGRRFQWNKQGAVLAEVLDPGVDATADTLGQHFAQYNSQDGADNSAVLIEVKDVRGLPDYNRVVGYLKSLSTVSGIEPSQVTSNQVLFRLKAQSGRLDVAQSIALGHVLVAEPRQTATNEVVNSGESATKKPDLIYRLLR